MDVRERLTSARALRMLARHLEFRADILKQVAMTEYSMAGLELRKFAQRYREAADRMLVRTGHRRAERRKSVATHRVYMRFERSMETWRVSFKPASGNESLRDLTFASSDKIVEMAARAGALRDLATKQSLEHALRSGLGGLYLNLTDDQLNGLRTKVTQRGSARS